MNLQLDSDKSQQLFIKILGVIFIVRLIFSAWIPLTGDEAYFFVWGQHLDYGYYDHTPFIGWLLAAFLTVSDAVWWLRLPSVLLPVVLAYGIYRILQPRNPEVAALVALTYLVAPINVINVFITTDTPLVFFSFISAWFFYRALYENNNSSKSNKYFIFCGLFLGLAFFSKYFAVLLGVAYGLYIVFFCRNRKGWFGLALIILMVLPFIGINLYWNYNNCWDNILFNIYNRTSGPSNIISNFILYAVLLVYAFSPGLIYYLFKNKNNLRNVFQKNIYHVYLWVIGLPLFLFSLLLFKKEIGLHWILSFYPFAFIAVAPVLNIKQWRATFYFMFIFSVIHLLILSSILTLPTSLFTSSKTAQQDFSFGSDPGKFLDQLKKYENEYTFSTVSYGMASIASHYSKKDFLIFGEASVHGRQSDKNTDFKDFNGKNILILKRSESYLDIYKKYFDSSERKKIQADGISFELFLGKGFKYALYREDILSVVNKDYYSIPDWLPEGSCGFKEKYGFNGN